ncbi:MAG: response regulator [Caulobacteraceae bacterium]|nr:response regulator [Caulobacteraceae bacterium]
MTSLDSIASAQPATAPNTGLCLLIVEDDDADAYLITHAVAGHPAVARVVRARDGVEAMETIETGEIAPDMAFVDLQMPRKNGFNLLTALAQRPGPGFPIIVLTSSSSPLDAQRSRLRLAAGVITKPDTTTLLEEVLTAAIDAACLRKAAAQPEDAAF